MYLMLLNSTLSKPLGDLLCDCFVIYAYSDVFVRDVTLVSFQCVRTARACRYDEL